MSNLRRRRHASPEGAVRGGGAAGCGDADFYLRRRFKGLSDGGAAAPKVQRSAAGSLHLFVASVDGENAVDLFDFCHDTRKLGGAANADGKHCTEIAVFKRSG